MLGWGCSGQSRCALHTQISEEPTAPGEATKPRCTGWGGGVQGCEWDRKAIMCEWPHLGTQQNLGALVKFS